MESSKLDAIAVGEALKGNLLILHEGDRVVVIGESEFMVIRADSTLDDEIYLSDTVVLRDDQLLRVYTDEDGETLWLSYVPDLEEL